MIGSEILLYPETGPEFLQALKMAVLYSERVHVMTLLDKDEIASLREKVTLHADQAAVVERRYRLDSLSLPISLAGFGLPTITQMNDGISQYVEFAERHFGDLDLLVKEGILIPRFPQVLASGGTFRPDERVLRAFERWPPSFADIGHDGRDPPEAIVGKFLLYLCLIASIAQRAELGLATWSLDFSYALWTSVWQLADGGPISMAPIFAPGQAAQQGVREAQLAQTVLERYLPRVDDLSISDILELRRKHGPELEAFRIGVRKLATDVDLSQAPPELDLQLKDIVSKEIDPAVHNLQASLTEARRNILKNIATDKALERGLMSVVISWLWGVPSDIGTLIGLGAAALPAVVQSALQSEVERSNLLRKNPWSILFRLRELESVRRLETRRKRDPFNVGP